MDAEENEKELRIKLLKMEAKLRGDGTVLCPGCEGTGEFLPPTGWTLFAGNVCTICRGQCFIAKLNVGLYTRVTDGDLHAKLLYLLESRQLYRKRLLLGKESMDGSTITTQKKLKYGESYTKSRVEYLRYLDSICASYTFYKFEDALIWVIGEPFKPVCHAFRLLTLSRLALPGMSFLHICGACGHNAKEHV